MDDLEMMVRKIEDYIDVVSSCRVDNIKFSFEDIVSGVLDEVRDWMDSRIQEEYQQLLKVIMFFDVEFQPCNERTRKLKDYLEFEYLEYCKSNLEKIYVEAAVKLNEMGA